MPGTEKARRHRFLSVGAILLALGTAAPVSGQEFKVNLEKENRVRFVSDAPLEDFEGVTDRMDGFLFLEGEGLGGETDLGASEFYFEVDLASLDTGIGLRNRHMRDNYLETDKYPFAAFSGRVVGLEESPAGTYRARSRGVFAVHGVEREREIECVAARSQAGLRVRCAFQVVLTDHEIPIPKLMFMKINEVMELDLDFFLSPASGGEGGRTW